MARLIRPDGRVDVLTTKNPEGFNLRELQSFVGGFIEVIELDRPVVFVDEPGVEYWILVVNEEGQNFSLAPNYSATQIWADSQKIRDAGAPNILVGNVVFVTEEEFQ